MPPVSAGSAFNQPTELPRFQVSELRDRYISSVTGS
jgi:hypothetical protein